MKKEKEPCICGSFDHVSHPTGVLMYDCKRCGHLWIPRVIKPVKCPNCLSKNWNKGETRPQDNRSNPGASVVSTPTTEQA